MKRLKMIAVFALCVTLLSGCGGIYNPVETTEDPLATYVPETTIEPTVIPATINPEDNVTPDEIADSLAIENISPYTGIFVECDPEDQCRVEGIYALKVTNTSDKTILNALLNYNDGTNDLVFYIEMLPAGQTIVVAEQNMQEMENEYIVFTGGAVNYLEEGMEAMDKVEITPTDNSTLFVKNVSEEYLPLIWVFYRQTDREGRIIGGRCYSAMAGDLPPLAEYEAEAPDWRRSCVIVNVLVLDAPSE
jgi:hypothetical protein